jgi:hypothetical protein
MAKVASVPVTGAPGFAPGQMVLSDGDTSQEEKDKKEIERLRSQHLLYEEYLPEWALYLSAYEGGPSFTHTSNLFKHVRETDDDYYQRVKRLHYLNYCAPLVDFFSNFIFADTIQRDGGSNKAFYDEFVKDVNRKQETIDEFMEQVCDDMQIYGMRYTEVTAPQRPDIADRPLTKQIEKDYKLQPYWVQIPPEEILDWVVDSFDSFTYAKRRQLIDVMENGGKKSIEKFTEYYADNYEISEVDITDARNPKLIKSREKVGNSLGLIPLEVTRFQRSKRYSYMGNSFLRDLAYNNREIMNLTSLLQEFLYRQAFNILAKETEMSIPTNSQEDGVIGTANVLEYPKGAKPPSYITPPADPAKFIQDERERIKQEMFRRAAQDTLNELFNGEKASGFSQAQSFSKTVPFIASRADVLQRTEYRLMVLTMKFMNKKWDGTVKYKDRYELTNLTDAMTQLLTLARDLQMPSPTFVKIELEQLVAQYDGKLTTEQRETVLKEIGNFFDAPAKFAEWQDVQKQALIGQNKPEGSSPGAQQKPKSSGTMAEAAAESGTSSTAATKKVKS